MPLPGIFEPTIFSPRVIRVMTVRKFIPPIHPKTEIRPTSEAIRKILDAQWVGQIKIHGHRAQIHLPPKDSDEKVLVFNRQGQLHRKTMPEERAQEFRRIFAGTNDWTVLDGEWLKGPDDFYLFDVLQSDGESLRRLSFKDRWERLPRVYASANIRTLGLLNTVEKCLRALESPDPKVEGLVFRSLNTPGFSSTSIVRCRKAANRS